MQIKLHATDKEAALDDVAFPNNWCFALSVIPVFRLDEVCWVAVMTSPTP
jgi:hypothetical protein